MNTEQVNQLLNRAALYIALLVAWVAMLGSLYFSEVLGYIPCQLCWVQRIFMYPLAGVLAIGLLRRDPHLPYLVLPFSLIGMCVSTYHYLLQKTDIFGSSTVCQTGVPCSMAWINWFGFVTIPFLALTAFFLITVFSLVALTAGEPDPDVELRFAWLPVAGIVAAVMLVFGVMRLMHGASQPSLALAELPAMTQAQAPTPIATLSGATIQRSGAALPEAAPEGANGERLYREACAACHGPDAAGVANLGNSLVASEIVLELPDAEVLAFIRQGVDLADPRNTSGLVMPPSGGRPDLSDDDMLAILAFLRAGAPTSAD
jgi:disulfide bond formation protein DsbB